jgi:hypothetical protein
LKGLGDQAEIVVPNYGVIVHGISTKSINIKDQKATIQQMLADNYTVIPDAEISYVGWLTREGPLKRESSIVVEFTAPEMADAVIYAAMVWEGQIHQCQLYARTPRVKQCLLLAQTADKQNTTSTEKQHVQNATTGWKVTSSRLPLRIVTTRIATVESKRAITTETTPRQKNGQKTG